MTEKTQVAQKASEALYGQLLAEQYEAIYASATDEFKASVNRERFVAFIKTANQKVGLCRSPTLALTSYHLGGEIVDLTYTRKCALGEISEMLAWKIVNGRAVLNGWILNNNNPAQLTK